MLTIKTHLKQTENKGIGLFSSESVLKGGKVWILDERFYRVFSETEIDALPTLQKDFIMKYGTWGVLHDDSGRFLDLDDTRFMNHSNNPNICFVGHFGIALDNISEGDELTCDYKTLGDERERKLNFENKE